MLRQEGNENTEHSKFFSGLWHADFEFCLMFIVKKTTNRKEMGVMALGVGSREEWLEGRAHSDAVMASQKLRSGREKVKGNLPQDSR